MTITTKENAKSAELGNLPALTGSVKQIAWATDIRAKKLAYLDEFFDNVQSRVNDDAQLSKNKIARQALRNVLNAKAEAKFWIDNRNTESKKLIVANNLQAEYKAEFDRLSNMTATGTNADVEPETDGSEEDTDDEKFTANVMPPADDEKDDELVDPPIIIKATSKSKQKGKQLTYSVGNLFPKDKKLTHPEGKNFYFVAWDYRSNCERYWLTYTTNSDEDEKLLAEQTHAWIKITHKFAIELVKRGGQNYPGFIPDWFYARVHWSWLPIFPFCIDLDTASFIINRRKHTVEQPASRNKIHYPTKFECDQFAQLREDCEQTIAEINDTITLSDELAKNNPDEAQQKKAEALKNEFNEFERVVYGRLSGLQYEFLAYAQNAKKKNIISALIRTAENKLRILASKLSRLQQ